MSESKIKWKGTNLPYRRSPDILYGYYPHREVEHHSPSLNCGLCMATSFQWGQYEEEESSGETWWTLPRPGDWGQSQQWKVLLIICSLGMLKWKITLCLCDLPPQNPQTQADHEEKQQTNTIRRSCYKIPDLSSKLSRPPKARKTRETVTAKRSLRSHDD